MKAGDLAYPLANLKNVSQILEHMEKLTEKSKEYSDTEKEQVRDARIFIEFLIVDMCKQIEELKQNEQN